MPNQTIDKDKVKFIYEGTTTSNKEREEMVYANLHTWVEPFVKRINDQDGAIEIYFKGIAMRYNFSNIAEPLSSEMNQYIDDTFEPVMGG